MKSAITFYDRIPERWLNVEPLHAMQLLHELEKPTVVKYSSPNPKEGARWMVTLQHANESSGLYAFVDVWKKLMQSERSLDYDLYFVIANGYGAMAREDYPIFGRRFSPDQIDWNRCWTKPEEVGRGDMPARQREQVEELTSLILETNPEYMIDIHNTTGKNKPLAFVQERYAQGVLVHNLVNHIIYSGVLPGSLLDRFSDVCETVTLECGKTGTFEALYACQEMLRTFINFKTGNEKEKKESPLCYQELGRMVIKENVDFSFYNPNKENREFTEKERGRGTFLVRSDIENFNQTHVHDFGSLGVYEGEEFPLRFLEHGVDKSDEYFQIHGREIKIAKPTYGLLFTTNVHNIRVTELGYLMERV